MNPLNQDVSSNAGLPSRSSITRAAGVVGAATLLSRIFGYLRDMTVASFFGTGMASDAFFVAFSIPNLLRRLFAEGSLSAAFIPVFSRHLKNEGLDKAVGLANSALRVTALVVLTVCALGMVFAPRIVHVLAYGWADQAEKVSLCVTLTRIMLPYILFISLVALCMGILNVLGHFAAPALAPVLLNTGMIASVFIGAWFTSTQMELVHWLAFGVFFGGTLQLLLQVPFLCRKGIALMRAGPLWHPGLNRVMVMLGPAIFGAAIYQINSLIIRFFASMLPEGSISYLYYADRLIQFPLGIFGMAAATAVLPALSYQAAAGRWDDVRNTFTDAMRMVLFITLPSMVGLIVLREPIISLLFQRGAFDAISMRLTAGALLYYGIGLWAFSAVRIVLNTFYALQETATPVRIGLVAIASNTVLSVLLIRPMQHEGLALALSLSSMLNLGLLVMALRKRLGSLGWRKIAASTRRSLLCSGAMGMVVWGLARYLIPLPIRGNWLQLLGGVTACIIAGCLIYTGLAYIFRAPELHVVLQMVLRKKKS